MSSVQRVLILSIKAGAGHLRAAQALEAAFHEEHPGVEVRHVEALQLTSPAFRKAFTGVYERLVKHLKYKKYLRARKKFKAHDQRNVCQVGDQVEIIETRPLSREKRWAVVSVLKKAAG